jgi:hypothetical protein
MACPGSVALSKDVPRKDTVFSKEGTAAHKLGEIAYEAGMHPSNWLGEKVEDVEVTHDMVNAVAIYVDYLRDLAILDNELMLEHKFDLSKLNPPAPMFGTSDCTCYVPHEFKLIVADYKHGAGVAVEVENNTQLMYYALGAMLELGKKKKVEEIEMVIIQPRAQHRDGPIRKWSCTRQDILKFAGDLIAAAQKTMVPEADLHAGKHCRFCPAQPRCPALHHEAKEIAKLEFTETAPLVDPRLLSAEQVGYILERADLIEDWVRSIRVHVQSELESGKNVPGWKLVQKRALRSWNSPTEVIQWAEKIGLDKEELYDYKMKSPAALEKVVGKKDLPKDLYSAVSSGYTLAPASDPRTAITSVAADEFSALPSIDVE